MTTVVLVGTLDTKGREYARWRELVEAAGARCILVDAGILGDSEVEADIDAAAVAWAAGADLEALRGAGDRGASVRAMAAGTAVIARGLHPGGGPARSPRPAGPGGPRPPPRGVAPIP